MYHEKVFFFQILVCFIVLLAGNVYSLGITTGNSIVFKPYLDKDYDICVRNSEGVPFPVFMEVTGPLKDYVTLEETDFILEPHQNRCFKYNVNLPASLDKFGNIQTQIWARQKGAASGSGFQILANIHHKLSVFVPYPEKYVLIKVRSEDVNENEPVQLTVQAKNYGSKDVEKANCRLDFFGADDYTNYVDTIYTNTKSIASMETVNFVSILQTTGLKPGYYKVDAILFYDGNKTQESKMFKIGTLFVRINNYTDTAYSGRINQFDVAVESRWNNRIARLYAEAEFEGLAASVTTPTVGLSPWKESTLTGYLDLKNVAPGDYAGNITLYYENESNRKSVILHVLGGAPEEKVAAKDEPEPIVTEDRTIVTVTNILLVLILAVIVIDAFYVYKKRKKHEKTK